MSSVTDLSSVALPTSTRRSRKLSRGAVAVMGSPSVCSTVVFSRRRLPATPRAAPCASKQTPSAVPPAPPGRSRQRSAPWPFRRNAALLAVRAARRCGWWWPRARPRRRRAASTVGKCERRSPARSAASRIACDCARAGGARRAPARGSCSAWPALMPWTRCGFRVAAQMDHLGAGVGLLAVVGHRDRVELAARAVTTQHHARVLQVMAEPVQSASRRCANACRRTARAW